MVITRRSVQESRDENRSRSIDYTGSALIALTLGPLILALSKGSAWGWASARDDRLPGRWPSWPRSRS